ncbi:proteasome subunit PSA5 (PSA5) [Vairimorpha necatrix]|uniref:Proteasome subunit PSA5 (PSA5) n=1 Tax=Vairimorpha necatrix TaxID=6039 RepID=A0AAX4JA11_9MICR|nr:Chain D, Proteasome subunit alpha type-5 [Vairimorpha necatrix]8ADN_R Chain R, Proteasome subunit alpha type-5 [Vairimorpha necatrix]
MSIVSRQNANTYSAEGRLYQVEYAMQAMNLGTSSIGIKTKDYVLLASEKKIISKLQNPSSVKKHYRVYDHIALGFSGISADVKTIVDKSRNFAINHEYLYDENCKVERLLEHLADLSLNFDKKEADEKIFSRPFGASLLIIGYDTEPRLFSLDPSGSYLEYHAKAIGSGSEVIENMLEQEFDPNVDINSGLKNILNMLSKVMKDKINNFNVEITAITKNECKILTPEEIEQFLE